MWMDRCAFRSKAYHSILREQTYKWLKRPEYDGFATDWEDSIDFGLFLLFVYEPSNPQPYSHSNGFGSSGSSNDSFSR